MSASKQNPTYSIYLVDGETKYNITPAAIAINSSDQKKQMAKSVTINLMNVQVQGIWLTNIIKVRERVFIYADDGENKEEVFRGFVWRWDYQSALDEREIAMKCYDNLIYFQESEESEYFSSGKSTKDVIAALCQKWGVNLEYSYESITHEKLPLRGNLSDIITSDLLDLVQDRTGKKYVILSEQDTIKIKTVGQNTTIYSFKSKENAILTKTGCTMDGMITKVVIQGKADDDDRRPVEASLTKNTDRYGTLQSIIDRDENTSLEDAKKEAQNILDENADPTWEYEVRAVDVPWIRKGDKVIIDAGNIDYRELIVVGITRSIDIKGSQMTLTMEKI